MPKFRKKPVVIEAFQVPSPGEAGSFMPRCLLYAPPWLLQAVKDGKVDESNGALLIHTLEGVMRAEVGDLVIQGVKGELYPCKPDIFAATYEPA